MSGITADGFAEMPFSGAYSLGAGENSAGTAPWGGSRHGDGLSASDTLPFNVLLANDEAVWNADQAPLTVVMIGHGFMPDTGGPGQHRGGVGTYRDARWLEPTTQSTANPRVGASPRRQRRPTRAGSAGPGCGAATRSLSTTSTPCR